MAVLVCIGASQPAYADDVYRTSDGGFTYQGVTYSTEVTIKPGDSRGLATTATGNVTAYENINTAKTKASYIYFAKGVDPKTATTALYTTFDYTPPSTYSNQSPSPPQSLTISDNAAVASSQNAGNCTIPGLGWILCPVGDFLSNGVDWAYKIVMVFMDVQPMMQNGPIYDVWNAIRSLANIVFVIVFLIVIFSQVTSLGISAYGIRKMLPRLVIAAILVNLSFIICALAVDLSNVLGHAVYAYVHQFYESMATNMAIDFNWSDITSFVLAGGITAGGVTAGWIWFTAATAGGAGAVFFVLLGLLLTVALAALTALVILFARQGLLIILTLVSPFAFVAMTLPSTEKWYKKWQDTFMSLLLMFPIFSFVFSGALLAGGAIIISSGGNILLIVLGKTVQVLPLAITPLLIKLSNGALGTVAQFVSGRNKKLLDSAKGWTEGQREHYRKKSREAQSRWYNPWRSTAKFIENVERRQKLEQQGFEDSAQARAQSTLKYRRAYHYAGEQKLRSETTDNNLKASWDEARQTGTDWRGRTNPNIVTAELVRRQSEVNAKSQAEKLEKMHAEIVAEGANSQHLQNLNITNAKVMATLQASAAGIKSTTEEIVFTGIAKKMAERTHQDNIANILRDNDATVEVIRNGGRQRVSVREYAGGIQGEQGQNSALAYAVALQRKQYGEAVNEMSELIKHMNVDTGDLQEMIMGRKASAVGHYKDSSGNLKSFDFKKDNAYAVEAALENNIAIGTVPMVDEILIESGGRLDSYKTTIAAALAKAGHSGRSIYQGGRLISMVGQGQVKSRDDLLAFIQGIIADGKFSANQLADLDAPAAENFLAAAQNAPLGTFATPAERAAFATKLSAGVTSLKTKANTALSSSYTRDRVKENTLDTLTKIKNL